MNENRIFPKFELIQESESTVSLRTFLRKKHTDDRWYLIPIKTSWDGERDPEKHYAVFLQTVYSFLILGQIYPNLMTHDGMVVNKLDDNQEDERNRIIRLITNK